ncbi:hypothetical protein [Aggregatibacter actinomycetemcomitans]|uniref:hypothetical protein n=1 Tax=Aggregatibacter actinomycetemcomitans TaxID=714 RepID=UPI0001B9F2DF|nr:hypothetical protein [Aggregatibacter actinomycetemcomitans]ACX83262.1 hypothetical protein D11S_1907 [Aggregatibacter actinomycetemcomitans D11S-1]KOE58842.1 hypothetical protein SCC2302_0306360 [Aggregatibacter actinomycetemcomitans serotype c str. SCC2302]KOE58979.1 hypothetical protein AAS4A_0205555 [Aggregatibacter actinomycetemcomitans serotype c str. AAS4A]KOE61428.1 hypothetical protein D17P2_0307755 [Aggregatibacter actinomycetemcomitans serotype c str. D17P-2]KYK72996.1 hypothetic
MLEKLLILTLPFIIIACATQAPEPKSWKKDLDGIQEENINNDIDQITKDIIAPQPQIMEEKPKGK